MIYDTHSAQISQKEDECNVIMKTMCPPGYHHNGFVATDVVGHMMLHIAGTNEPKSALWLSTFHLSAKILNNILSFWNFLVLHISKNNLM